MEQGDGARCITARFDLAAVGVENAHKKIGAGGVVDNDQLVAPNAGPPIRDGAGKALGKIGQRRCSCVQHDEIVAQSMHFYEVDPHGRALGCAADAVKYPVYPAAARPVSG